MCCFVGVQVWACVCQSSQRPEEVRMPGAELTGECELMCVGSKNQILFHFKRIMCPSQQNYHPVQILAFNSLHQLLLKSASIAKCFHIGILAWWKRHTGLEEGSVLSVYFWKSFYERSKWPTRVIRVHKRNDVDCCSVVRLTKTSGTALRVSHSWSYYTYLFHMLWCGDYKNDTLMNTDIWSIYKNM